MLKILIPLSILLFLATIGFSIQGNSDKENEKIIEVETGSPIVISLSNKHDGGDWECLNKPVEVEIQEKRKGYLSTYFVFKSQQKTQGPIVFIYKNGNQSVRKVYFIKVREKNSLSQTSYTDKNKEGQKTVDNPNTLTIVTKNSKTSSVTDMPDDSKSYIDDLLKENLTEKAFSELSKYEENEQLKGSIDKKWIMRKKIEILEKQNKYDQLIGYVNSLLEQNKEKQEIPSELEFDFRLSRAKAEYYRGKKEEAHSQFIYLKNYYPKNPQIYYELGNFYIKEEMIKKGVSFLEYLVSKFDDPPAKDEVYYKLATYYYQVVGLNGYNLSYKYYDKIVKLGIISPYYKESKKMVEFLEKNFINIR